MISDSCIDKCECMSNYYSAPRDEIVDFLKGLAIYLVVLGHINPPQEIVDIIYSFHMALFMFLSGCTFWFSYRKNVQKTSLKMSIEYMLSRARTLLLPYVLWSVIWSAIHNGKCNPVTAMVNCFDRFWFLPTLFLIISVASIVEFVVSKTTDGGGMEFLLKYLPHPSSV